jgi:hypothetical protein
VRERIGWRGVLGWDGGSGRASESLLGRGRGRHQGGESREAVKLRYTVVGGGR